MGFHRKGALETDRQAFHPEGVSRVRTVLVVQQPGVDGGDPAHSLTWRESMKSPRRS